jgi:two-component system, OmpR family, osmolarity sensor histidine kinase EnvZ
MTTQKRIHIWPQSLWGQVLASTLIVIALGQILSTMLFTLLVLRPEVRRVSLIMAENIAAVSKVADGASPEERARLIKTLGQSSYIEIWPDSRPPDNDGPRPRLLERVFMRQLVTALGDKTDLTWRTDRRHRLWMHLYIGPDAYWVSIKAMPSLGPTGLVLVSGLISLLLALVLAFGLNGRLFRPLETLKQAAEGFRLATKTPALDESGPREIASLSHSFNLMFQRLQQTETDRALILAGISHDLRTPLAKLRLALDMMPHEDEALRATAHRQVETIDRILGQFMTYARGFDAEAIGQIDTEALLDEALREYADQGVTIRPHSLQRTLAARPEALRRALCNLIENALRYGTAPVEIACEAAGDGIDLIVRDHGPGIPADKLARITEPFVRGDEARGADHSLFGGGTGLGLAMVEKIAALHGGRLKLSNLADGFEARLSVKG